MVHGRCAIRCSPSERERIDRAASGSHDRSRGDKVSAVEETGAFVAGRSSFTLTGSRPVCLDDGRLKCTERTGDPLQHVINATVPSHTRSSVRFATRIKKVQLFGLASELATGSRRRRAASALSTRGLARTAPRSQERHGLRLRTTRPTTFVITHRTNAQCKCTGTALLGRLDCLFAMGVNWACVPVFRTTRATEPLPE